MLSKWKSQSNGIAIPLVNYSNGEASAIPKPSYSISPTKHDAPPSSPNTLDTGGVFDTPEDEQILQNFNPVLTEENLEKHIRIERKERREKKDRREDRRKDEGDPQTNHVKVQKGSRQMEALRQLCQYLELSGKPPENLQENPKPQMGSLKVSPRGGGSSADLELVRRVKKKFESLEHTSMERYQAREQKVVSTLDFCMTALEQLRSWAVFAIFPTDENQKDKYVQFVQQRYSCVVDPLRLFLHAIERCKSSSSDVTKPRRTSRDCETERGRKSSKTSSPREQRSLSNSRYSGLGDISIQRGNRFKNTPESPRLGHPMVPPPLDLQGLDDPQDEEAPIEHKASDIVSLRDYINRISREHSEEGAAIKDAVMEKLRKCRKDSKTLYKWGQASLLDLQEILDETLADELYFMVRSKMARVLSTISIFEETAEQIERSLSNHFQGRPNGSVSERGTSSTGKVKKQVSPQHLVRENSGDLRGSCDTFSSDRSGKSTERLGPSDGSSNPSNSGRFDDLNDLDLRIEIPSRDSPTGSEGNELEDLLLTWSFNGGNIGQVRLGSDHEKHSEASTPRSSSTPEPPISPRPRALVNHPKIMKDKLHSMALPSKFPGFAPGRASASW